jgi:hypothetical protein
MPGQRCDAPSLWLRPCALRPSTAARPTETLTVSKGHLDDQGGIPTGTGGSIGLAFAGIFVAAIGVFFFGEYALMVGVIFVGLSVVALATEVDERSSPGTAKSTPTNKTQDKK